MIPPGFISRLIKYYMTQPRFNAENEWLIYDFELSDGRTLLQHWVEENPLRISRSQLADYRTLLETQQYGFYKVLDVFIDVGLKIEHMILH